MTPGVLALDENEIVAEHAKLCGGKFVKVAEPEKEARRSKEEEEKGGDRSQLSLDRFLEGTRSFDRARSPSPSPQTREESKIISRSENRNGRLSPPPRLFPGKGVAIGGTVVPLEKEVASKERARKEESKVIGILKAVGEKRQEGMKNAAAAKAIALPVPPKEKAPAKGFKRSAKDIKLPDRAGNKRLPRK